MFDLPLSHRLEKRLQRSWLLPEGHAANYTEHQDLMTGLISFEALSVSELPHHLSLSVYLTKDFFWHVPTSIIIFVCGLVDFQCSPKIPKFVHTTIAFPKLARDEKVVLVHTDGFYNDHQSPCIIWTGQCPTQVENTFHFNSFNRVLTTHVSTETAFREPSNKFLISNSTYYPAFFLLSLYDIWDACLALFYISKVYKFFI